MLCDGLFICYGDQRTLGRRVKNGHDQNKFTLLRAWGVYMWNINRKCTNIIEHLIVFLLELSTC